VLNHPRYEGASILLTRANFGCGSSREHAPWALAQYGFRVLLASSFADIFFNNCFKNGLLPIVLDTATIDRLFQAVQAQPGYHLTVDLPTQQLIEPSGHTMAFDIAPFSKECLLHGWDDIGLTLRHQDKIVAFETARLKEKPWLVGGKGLSYPSATLE
jgi:3-isopropylmalate/(R)-2-methylmalate dehydratase small subunit